MMKVILLGLSIIILGFVLEILFANGQISLFFFQHLKEEEQLLARQCA